jgi:HAE1 family hydrophobic/amphiphilic exporter-1
MAESSYAKMMREEFTAIIQAVLIAMWLVFMVMTMQFESGRYAAMIMFCIPFSLIGSFLLMFVTQSTLSMTSLMGFLMLEGIVVNNGILMVDTTNQFMQSMSMELALVEAGKSRLRPILMTTLTTILSMMPLAMGIGKNTESMQGMAVVIVGGLIASTLLTLILLPTFYIIIAKRSKTDKKTKKFFFKKRKAPIEAERDDDREPRDEGVDN